MKEYHTRNAAVNIGICNLSPEGTVECTISTAIVRRRVAYGEVRGEGEARRYESGAVFSIPLQGTYASYSCYSISERAMLAGAGAEAPARGAMRRP